MRSPREGGAGHYRRVIAIAAVAPLALASCGGGEDGEDAAEDGEAAIETTEDTTDEVADDTGSETVDTGTETDNGEADAAADDTDGDEDAAETTAVDETVACEIEDLPLHEPGMLTIATGEPVFPPWMIDDDPTNGEGFESAVAYALAEEMGFSAEQVVWERSSFDAGLEPGEKEYDFNMQQYTITAERDEIVDFSLPYYIPDKALVALLDSPAAAVATFADLESLTLGAKVGTTDLAYIEDVLGFEAAAFEEQVDVVGALATGEIDAMVVTLPTAFFLTAVQVDNSVIVGVLPTREDVDDAGIGLLFSEGNELVTCVDVAMQALTDDGTLAMIAEQWLQGGGEIPDITP